MSETIGQESARVAHGEAADRNDDVSLLWVGGVMLRERRRLLAFVAIGAILSVAVALLRDRTWTATFSFIPQQSQSSSGGLAGLADQFGVPLGAIGGGDQPPELYADLLLTREVLTPIAGTRVAVSEDSSDRKAVPELLGLRDDDHAVLIDKTIRVLRNDVVTAGIENRTTGMVGVRVRTTSPFASFELANLLLDEMTRFNLVTRQSEGRAEREFTARRLEEERASLRAAEESLQLFLEKNRALGDSPRLAFERDRRQRDVDLRQQLVNALSQQYEEARLKEVRDTPVITMIDSPAVPARPDSRMLILIVLAGTLLALFAGMLYVLARESWTQELRRGRDPGIALISDEWRSMRGR